MKIILTRPALIGDIVYREDSVVDCPDEGRCKFMIAMKYAKAAPSEAKVSEYQPYVSPKPVTAVDVGAAVAEAIAKGMSFPDTAPVSNKAGKG